MHCCSTGSTKNFCHLSTAFHSSGVVRMCKIRGHSVAQCVRNMHMLGNLGHAPAMKIFLIKHSEIAFAATNTQSYLLHVHMKLAIAHADL